MLCNDVWIVFLTIACLSVAVQTKPSDAGTVEGTWHVGTYAVSLIAVIHVKSTLVTVWAAGKETATPKTDSKALSSSSILKSNTTRI